MINTSNDIFKFSNIKDFSEEIFETLLQNDKIKIERIISTGQITPEGEWQDPTYDEWVILLQGEGELTFEDGEVLKISKGGYFHIPAHRKHRVSYTSSNPQAIWIAVHF